MVLRRHETEGLRGRIGREKLEMQLHLPPPPRPRHAPRRSPMAPKRSPPLRRHPPRSPQPARLPHNSSWPLRGARSRRGQSFERLAHSQTAPTAPPPRCPTWPATRKTGCKHAPTSPPPGTHRRTGPAHPQRHSPGCRLAQRLGAPPAARSRRRRPFRPARPRTVRNRRFTATQRGPTPAWSSPSSWLPPATPSPPVRSRCSLRQAPAQQPGTAQPTPQVAAVRGS